MIVIVLPFLGVLIYLIANGRHMTERDIQQARAAQAEFDDRVRTAAGGGAGCRDRQGQALLDNGAINQTEFNALKTKALA